MCHTMNIISDSATYIFDKVNAKIESVMQQLQDAKGLYQFALTRNPPLSDETYAALKKDMLDNLREADKLLDETVLIGNCNLPSSS